MVKWHFFLFAEKNACLLVKEQGVCKGHYLRYHYDVHHEKCKTFYFSGCGGNGNRFRTTDDCFATCAGVTKDGRSKCRIFLTLMVLIMRCAEMWKKEGNFDFDLDHRDVEFCFVDDVSFTCLCQMFCWEDLGDGEPDDDGSDANVGQ